MLCPATHCRETVSPTPLRRQRDTASNLVTIGSFPSSLRNDPIDEIPARFEQLPKVRRCAFLEKNDGVGNAMRKFIAGLACGCVMAGGPALAQEISFRSPTGNIHCMIFAGDYAGARCDLSKFTPSYPRPADCDQDWGFAFEVGISGRGAPICAGDTVMTQNAPVLGYGHSVSASGITCTSAKTGMTCVNAEGHGFTVARRKQSAF